MASHKYGLRNWVTLLSLVPTLVVGSLLGGYFTLQRFDELESQLKERGRSIIEPLAMAAEYSMASQNRESLMRLIGAAQSRHVGEITSISVFDAQGQVYVSTNLRSLEHFQQPVGAGLPLTTEVERRGDYLYLKAPIRQLSSTYDVLVPGSKLDTSQSLGYIGIELSEHEERLQQHRAAITSFGLLLFGFLLNLLIAFYLTQRVTHPIQKMIDAIERIRQGRLDTRLNDPLIGGLDDLRLGINAMAKAIDENHDQMQQNIDQATSDLRETLEQIEIQNVQVDLARKKAQDAAKAKSEFLANMGHELRTPLNGILGFCRQLFKSSLSESQSEQLKTIDSSANNLLSIINDILDYSKLEAGKLQLEQFPLSLRDVIDEVMLLMVPAASQKRLELAVLIDQNVPDDLLGDAMRIKQILTNLVSNAIKFTESGSVIVRASVANRNAEKVTLALQVQDTGMGISETQQRQLFQAFSQGDSSITRRYGGTGLGLIISKRLVEQMQGEITLDSQLHRGSNFNCTLSCQLSPIPLSDPIHVQHLHGKKVALFEPQPHNRDAIHRQLESWHLQTTNCLSANEWHKAMLPPNYFDYVFMAIDGLPRSTLQDEVIRIAQVTHQLVILASQNNLDQLEGFKQIAPDLRIQWLRKPMHQRRLYKLLMNPELTEQPFRMQVERADDKILPVPAAPKRSLKVMAVDDNEPNLKVIHALLSDMVEEVALARSGEEAIALAKKQNFDIIFMDIQMPNIDGVTAMQRIRELPHHAGTQVIAVTAHALGEERRAGIKAGMNAYMTKPIVESELEKVLDGFNKSILPKHQLIDETLALQQAANKPELAQEMFNLLLDSLPETKLLLAEHWQNNDAKSFATVVHKLHGACCYSGVPQLQQVSAELESALKQGAALTDLEPEYLELTDYMAQLDDLTVS